MEELDYRLTVVLGWRFCALSLVIWSLCLLSMTLYLWPRELLANFAGSLGQITCMHEWVEKRWFSDLMRLHFSRCGAVFFFNGC